MTNIKDRVLYVAEIKGVSREIFFEELGLSYSNFKGIQKKSALSSDSIDKILTKYSDIDANWIITGKGNVIKSDLIHSTSIISEPKPIYGTPIKQKNVLGIPLIPIEAMAGYGSGSMQVMEYEAERFLVPTFKGADYLIGVRGSSMYPKYNSGDIVACKHLAIDTFFQWNKVYVLDTIQGALIKRVCKGSDEDHVLIVSDNEKFDSFELHRSEIHAIAIVVGVIRLE